MGTPTPTRILPEFVADARAAREWYASRSAKAAEKFIAELDNAIQQIRDWPNRWPRHRYGTRRYLLRHFPFLIIYRVDSGQIDIVACQHGRRRPGYWRERLK